MSAKISAPTEGKAHRILVVALQYMQTRHHIQLERDLVYQRSFLHVPDEQIGLAVH